MACAVPRMPRCLAVYGHFLTARSAQSGICVISAEHTVVNAVESKVNCLNTKMARIPQRFTLLAIGVASLTANSFDAKTPSLRGLRGVMRSARSAPHQRLFVKSSRGCEVARVKTVLSKHFRRCPADRWERIALRRPRKLCVFASKLLNFTMPRRSQGA